MKLTKEIIAKLEKEGFEIKEESICNITKKITLDSIKNLDTNDLDVGNYYVEDFPNGDNSIQSETVFTILKDGKIYDPKYERCQIEEISQFLEEYSTSSKKENKPIIIQVNENTRLVATQNHNVPFDKEINVFLEKKENEKYVFSQDIARISPNMELDEYTNSLAYKKNLINAYVYGDEENEDYTKKFEIKII